VTYGRIHGDANGRNFLFDGSKDVPSELQIIDWGGYLDCDGDVDRGGLRRPPLVFDLAQLESDVKYALMGTENSAPGYLDIDTGWLTELCAAEQQAAGDRLKFSPTGLHHPSAQTAYGVVFQIRQRAGAPGDPEGRAYSLCLLYWALRKLRRKDLPHTKRLLALYSYGNCFAMSESRGYQTLHHWIVIGDLAEGDRRQEQDDDAGGDSATAAQGTAGRDTRHFTADRRQ
jgi:hypothetical protein